MCLLNIVVSSSHFPICTAIFLVLTMVACHTKQKLTESFLFIVWKLHIQPLNFAYKRSLNKPYENEVTMTGQKPPSKCCQHLETLHTLRKGLDLLMLKILGQQVKGLQSYQLSNLEFSRKSLPPQPFFYVRSPNNMGSLRLV